MRKPSVVSIIFFVAALGLSWQPDIEAAGRKARDPRQVTICHIPPGSPLSQKTITVGAPAVKAHLAHGDTLGPCPGDTTDVITESALHWESKLSAFMEAGPPPAQALRIVDCDDRPLITVKVVGPGTLVENPEIARSFTRLGPTDPGTGGEREPDLESVRMDTQALRVFNSASRLEFEVTVDGEFLESIYNIHLAEGLTKGTDGVDDPLAAEMVLIPALTGEPLAGRSPVPRPGGGPSIEGWSNGVDTRVLLPNPAGFSTWRKIANFGSCTGTLIGPRHVITAAHCINEKGTFNWYDFTVTPAQDGAGTAPFGSSDITDVVNPGDPFRWYFTPKGWRDCDASENCGQWDWGLIIIPDRLGNQTGWMGYVARPASQLNNVSQFNRGYPVCWPSCGNSNNSPAGCQDARLYGDTALCGNGTYYNTGPDGWNRNITNSCDMSGGHSGSAVYHYFFDPVLNKSVPVVAMVAIQQACCFCGPNDDYPNASRRITPSDLGTISFFRQWKP